jgi:hypothetical protein
MAANNACLGWNYIRENAENSMSSAEFCEREPMNIKLLDRASSQVTSWLRFRTNAA